MSMSHEEAVQLLCSMFESWERETLMAVFESNGYHVERTIETIIGMEQPELANTSSQQQHSQRSNNICLCVGDVAMIMFMCALLTSLFLCMGHSPPRDSYGGGRHTHSQPTPNSMMFDSYEEHPSIVSSTETQSKRRGAPVQLPDDFLRVSIFCYYFYKYYRPLANNHCTY